MRHRLLAFFLFVVLFGFSCEYAEASGPPQTRTRGGDMPPIIWTITGTTSPCVFTTNYPLAAGDGIADIWRTPTPGATGTKAFTSSISGGKIWANSGSYVFTCSIGGVSDSATLIVNDCPGGTNWNNTTKVCQAVGGAPATPVVTFSIAPSSLEATNNFTWTWSGTNSPTRYEYYFAGATNVASATSPIQTNNLIGSWTVTPVAIMGQTPNLGSHTAYLRGCNATGCGAYVPAAFTIVSAAPAAPATPGNSNGTPGSCGTNQINFTWSASAGATSYEGQVNGGPWTSLGNVTNYLYTAPQPNTTYAFSVRAVNSGGVASAPAGPINRTSPAACPVTYTIVSSAGSGGTIAPLGTVSGIPAGASVGFTVSPSAGYVNTNIIVNGFPIGSGTGYTFSNVNSNQTISASFALASATGSITANNCVIPVGGSSCSSTVSWTTTSVASPVISGTNGWVVPGASGNNVSVTVPYGTTTFTLSDSNGQIAQRSVLAQCGGTASWNGSTCVASVASLSVNPPSCAIPIGQATCTVNFTWSAPGFVSPNLYNFTRNVMYSNAGSGTNEPFAITYGANTIYLRDGVSVQVVVGATGTCSGTWNGSLCVAGTPSATLSVGSCTIPVNTGSCNAPVSWTSANLTTTPSIEQNTIQFSTTSVVAPAAGLTRPMTFGSGLANTIRFMHSATALDTKSGTGTCALGTFWDSLKCAPVCAPNNDCASAASVTQAATVCIGGTFSIADGCGNTIVCNGARSCDYNWKEVAP